LRTAFSFEIFESDLQTKYNFTLRYNIVIQGDSELIDPSRIEILDIETEIAKAKLFIKLILQCNINFKVLLISEAIQTINTLERWKVLVKEVKFNRSKILAEDKVVIAIKKPDIHQVKIKEEEK
jgi:hypothetical protein